MTNVEMISDPMIADVQQKLRDLGYYAVGPIDGWITPKGGTAAAILDFRNQNDLPLTPTVDQQLIDTLATAKPRKIPTARLEATSSDVVAVVPVAQKNWWTKLWARILGIPAGIGFIGDLIINHLDDGVGKLGAVKQFFSDQQIPSWAWWGLAVTAALAIGYSAHKTETAAVEGYKEGSIKETGQ